MVLFLSMLAAAEPSSVGWTDVPVGTVVHSAHETDLVLDLEAGPAWHRIAVPVAKQHVQDVTMTVTAADERGPSAFSATWTRNHLVDRGPDGERDLDLPVLGKTYALVPRAPVDAPEAEAAIAAQQADFFALLRELQRMVAAPTDKGDTLPTGPVFAGLVRDAPGEPSVSGTLTSTGQGTFDVDLIVKAEGALRPGIDTAIEAHLQGRLEVDPVTGWTHLLDVAGPLTLTGTADRDGRSYPLSGTGRFRSTTALQYE